jgi:hypothetical protein
MAIDAETRRELNRARKVAPSPQQQPAPQQLDSSLLSMAQGFGINPLEIPKPGGGVSEEAPKSGIFTQTQTSRKMPDDLAIVDNINAVFQQLRKRDATQEELAIWLPALRSKYKSKDGTSKTTVKYTYRNGQLINTDYFTADNQDPKVWLEDQIKTKLLSDAESTVQVGIPEGPIGKNFVQVKNFAARNGIMMSDDAAGDYATKIVTGKLDEDTVFNAIRESAASAFPKFSDKIKAGIDLKTLADPFIQSMSSILEIPYTSIDLFDPTIRNALSAPAGGYSKVTATPGMGGVSRGEYTLYDFEKDLRGDARWQFTKNAKKTVADSALRILQDFGVQA